MVNIDLTKERMNESVNQSIRRLVPPKIQKWFAAGRSSTCLPFSFSPPLQQQASFGAAMEMTVNQPAVQPVVDGGLDSVSSSAASSSPTLPSASTSSSHSSSQADGHTLRSSPF
jgi:hypothetical protein